MRRQHIGYNFFVLEYDIENLVYDIGKKNNQSGTIQCLVRQKFTFHNNYNFNFYERLYYTFYLYKF